MAERRPTVLIALGDRQRAEGLAAYLAEEQGMRAILADEVASAGGAAIPYDLVVSDGKRIDTTTPHVMLDDAAGADGNVRAVLSATATEPVIGAALRLVAAGYRTTPVAAAALVRTGDDNDLLDAGKRSTPAAAVLTQREKQVIALLTEGASNKLIARRLDISVHTAKFHVAAILEKLGAVNRTDAIAIAMREGLVLV